MTTQVFQRGESVPCWAEVRNWAGTLIDPTQGIKITLRKPDGTIAKEADETEIDDLAMTKSETGKYVYYFDSSAKGDPLVDEPLGWWNYSCKAVDGSSPDERITITHGSFKLV